jgi:hypothetical protein
LCLFVFVCVCLVWFVCFGLVFPILHLTSRKISDVESMML